MNVLEALAQLHPAASRVALLPQAAPLVNAVRRAAEGDPAAVAELKERWPVGLDLLVPGSGTAAQAILRDVQATIGTLVTGQAQRGDYVEGEYRELGEHPWDPFTDWLKRQRFGSHVILGPEGEAKTTLALRLAEVWRRTTGYRVELVNFYPEDCPEWADRIGMSELKRRRKIHHKYMGATLDVGAELDDADDGEDDEAVDTGGPEIDPFRRRIVVIDEMSQVIGTGGETEGRAIAKWALTQGRHLGWLVIYIAQTATGIDRALFRAKAIYVKQPYGDEGLFDRDEPFFRSLWDAAAAHFAELRHARALLNSRDREFFRDARAWAYVHSRPGGYQGLMPFMRPSFATEEE